MSQFSDFLRQDQRLVMLRLLAELPGYTSNSSVLVQLLEQFGHVMTRDQVKTELAWLAEQGLVTTDDAGSVLMAKITERGADVAAGRARQPGVKRPGA